VARNAKKGGLRGNGKEYIHIKVGREDTGLSFLRQKKTNRRKKHRKITMKKKAEGRAVSTEVTCHGGPVGRGKAKQDEARSASPKK